MKSTQLAAFLLWVFGAGMSMAQSYYDPFHHVALPPHAPAWMQAIADDPSGVNFYQIDSIYQQWLNTNWDAKRKTRAYKPAVNYYRRWRRAYAPFVDRSGKIQLPTLDDYYARLEADNHRFTSSSFLKSITSPIVWHNIGPHRTRSTQTTKDSQACVFRIAASPTHPHTVYAGTETGVVFKTTDKGKNWTACNGAFNLGTEITAVAVHPTDPNTVYVGSNVALWKTTDGGENWVRLGKTLIYRRINSIKINPSSPQEVTVATETLKDKKRGTTDGGFFVSEDGGAHFVATFSGFSYDHELKPDDSNTIYLLARKADDLYTKLYVSHDGGRKFTANNMLEDYHWNAGRLAVSAAPNGGNYLYALVTEDAGFNNRDGNGKPHILQSKDGGKTFTDKTIRSNNSWSGQGTFFDIDERDGGQGYFDMMIGVSPKDPETVIFGLCNLYRSTTGGGGGWGRFYGGTGIGGYVALENMHPDMQDICVNGNDTWVTNDGGVKYSADFFATPGESRTTGIYTADYHGFDMGWNEDVMTGGRWHNGDAVQAASYGKGNTIHVGGVEKATGYVFLNDPYQVYFSDAATFKMPKDWNGDVKAIYGEYFANFTPYEVLRSNGRIVFDPRYALRFITVGAENTATYRNGNSILYQTLDNGKSFTALLDTEGDQIYGYEFARSNPNTIYVGTRLDMYCSEDNGRTWEKRTFPFDMRPLLGPWMLAVDPNNDKVVWAVDPQTPDALRKTEDGGKTWVAVDVKGLHHQKIYWMVLTGDEQGDVYLGTTDGARVYYRNNAMDEWEDYSGGLNPSARITRILPFYKNKVLRMATNQGLWEAPLKHQDFRPVAQPIALSLSKGVIESGTTVQFDSYSITGQEPGTQWEWQFSPTPSAMSNYRVRHPRVTFTTPGAYDVTLKVTSAEGKSHSRTIRKMIIVGHDNGDGNVVPGSGYDNPDDATKPTTGIYAPQISAEIKPNILLQGELITLYTKNLHEVKRLSIYDLKGNRMMVQEIPADQIEYTFSTSSFPAGAYLYEVMGEHFKSFGKILIQ